MSDIVERAEAIALYARLKCASCEHPSASHDDIGTCCRCECLCFEEPS